MSAINRIMEGYTGATDAANYEEAIVLDEELIEDEDFRFVWTESYSGGFPPINK